MFPVICKIGPLTVYSYGLMLAVSVIVCAFFLSRDAKKFGIESDIIFDLFFWTVLSGIVGARLFFIVLNLEYFLDHPSEIVMIQHGGLAWQGGFVLGFLCSIWFIKKKNLSLIKMIDMAAPYLALGQSLGRVGCFLNGCCFGKGVHWGIYFPVHSAYLHPTQLYSSLGLLIIFFILKRYQKFNSIGGYVFILYIILASSQRFIVEFYRADHYSIYLGLSIYQYVCLGFILVAVYARTQIKSPSRTESDQT